MKNFLKEAELLQGEMVSWRRFIHANPEVGDNLQETSEFVKNKLIEFGYEPYEICKCCIAAEVKGKKKGKCILIREDMDALPIEEKTSLPFRSTNGYMHACGHDMHTAMLLACAKLLKDQEDEIQGTIKLVFQPAEETLTGANSMISAGVLENPHVDAAITLHVDALSPWEFGTVTLAQPGVILASCDHYRIDITGKGGHGAYPNQAIDPINVGAHIHTALQEILSREICASDVAVLTQGVFRSGDAPNIIPHTAYLEGTLRTYDENVRSKCLKRMGEMCHDIASAFRAQAKVTVVGGCASFYNDEQLFASVEKYIKEVVGQEGYTREGNLGVAFASEDFANVSRLVPSIQMCLAVGSERDGNTFPMHHPQVVFDEKPMYKGVAALAHTAVRYLQDHI